MIKPVLNNAIPRTQVQSIVTASRRRIGLYGGTFNPVHNAHLLIAEQVRQILSLDRVDFLPNNVPPHVDHKDALAANLRINMLKLATADNCFLGIEMDEINRGGISYTYDTLRDLRARHPEVDYYFIIGGDMVDYLTTWYRIDDLTRLVNFVGIHRIGAKNESTYPVTWVDVPMIDFSSTDIRYRIRMGLSIKYMVPITVENYIKEHRLYLD